VLSKGKRDMSEGIIGPGLFQHVQKQGVALPNNVININLNTSLDEPSTITFTCHASPEILKAMYLWACENA